MAMFNEMYGVDLSDARPVVVRARRFLGRVTVDPARPLASLSPAELRKATFAAAVSAHESVVRRLEVPLASATRAASVMPSLLDVQLPFPLESCLFALTGMTRRADGRTEALAAAVRRQDHQAFLDRFAAAGVNPAVVDHEGLALWDESLREAQDKTGARIVVYLGEGRIALVLGRGDRLIASHGLRTALPADGSAAGEELLRLAGRIQHILRAQSEALASAPLWFWCGPGAARADLIDRLRAHLGDAVDAPQQIAAAPGAFLARALARRAIEGHAPVCNLRTGDVAHPALLVRAQAGRRRMLAGVIAAAAAVIAVNFAALQCVAVRADAIQTDIRTLTSNIAGDPGPRGMEALTAERAMSATLPGRAPFQRLLDPCGGGDLAAILAAAARSHIRLYDLSRNDEKIVLSGSAAVAGDIDRLAVALRERGWRPEISQGAPVDGRQAFTLRAGR